MKQIDKIVKGIVEPGDINVLWLDTNDPKSPILKAYADGKWEAISSEGGGGGSTEGAISYEPQELTEEQQMQARKNQGLYYKTEHEGELAANAPDDDWRSFPWAYTITDEQIVDHSVAGVYTFMKISDDTPAVSDLLTGTFGEGMEVSLEDPTYIYFSENDISCIKEEDGYYYMTSKLYDEALYYAAFIVVTSDNVNNLHSGLYDDIINPDGDVVFNNLSKGIWVNMSFIPEGSLKESEWRNKVIYPTELTYNGVIEDITPIETKYSQAVNYAEQQFLSPQQKMLARRNQGLYAKLDPVVTNITWDGDGTGKDGFVYWEDYLTFYKISEDSSLDANDINEVAVKIYYDGEIHEAPMPMQSMDVFTANVGDTLDDDNASTVLSGSIQFVASGGYFIMIAKNAGIDDGEEVSPILNGVYFGAGILD